jgi:hypothetical protein
MLICIEFLMMHHMLLLRNIKLSLTKHLEGIKVKPKIYTSEL